MKLSKRKKKVMNAGTMAMGIGVGAGSIGEGRNGSLHSLGNVRVHVMHGGIKREIFLSLFLHRLIHLIIVVEIEISHAINDVDMFWTI